MLKVVLYQNSEGGVSIIRPTLEYISTFGIDAIAKSDVPVGKPYKIVDAEEIPTDRTFRNAWVIDVAVLTDGYGTGETLCYNNPAKETSND